MQLMPRKSLETLRCLCEVCIRVRLARCGLVQVGGSSVGKTQNHLVEVLVELLGVVQD